ncbi:hypothetical protein [Klebsiella quasipneumoniae]|uniref:hypothetical protein n=1 Tax=Klebsiella quasipneumoniae TaxID=1463165 RepID=UPI001FB5A4AD|nr:hypothetical protein [Klebsiella quasipneumoniae]MCJ1860783.1 hypothetical protein [Klebsiella quasipneumoniae subsp. similipneumoniae]HBT0796162.1 hypothetical protein [Klebsiella pneumoniae]
MTKSTITRERLQEIAEDGFLKHGESKELARMALAAMDSEPVAEVLSNRPGNDTSTIDGALPVGTQLYLHAQPAPEYPEVLPCSVFLEPGLRFGKGVKTRLVLEAIQRRAEHYAELEAMTPDERAEYDAGIEAFKAMLPQPAPVVPDDVLEALQKVARIRLDMNDFDGDRRGIADCLCDAEEALIEVVNRRAATLAAAPQEVKP